MSEDDFQIRLRMYHRGDIALGPGKVALLEAIAREGSIRQAATSLGMSYKRAWSLVQTMNALFASPLVEACKGGEHGGGAFLTERGGRVVQGYRQAEAAMLSSQKQHLQELKQHLGDNTGRA